MDYVYHENRAEIFNVFLPNFRLRNSKMYPTKSAISIVTRAIPVR